MILLSLLIVAILVYWLYIVRWPSETDPPAVATHCPRCGSPVGADFRLCPACRGALRPTCPHCERHIEAGWTVCPFCGQGVLSPQETQGAPP